MSKTKKIIALELNNLNLQHNDFKKSDFLFYYPNSKNLYVGSAITEDDINLLNKSNEFIIEYKIGHLDIYDLTVKYQHLEKSDIILDEIRNRLIIVLNLKELRILHRVYIIIEAIHFKVNSVSHFIAITKMLSFKK